MNEQRYTPEDYETLKDAQFRYEERMQNVERERIAAYTTQQRKLSLKEIENEIIAERRQIFVALGLEEPTDKDIII